MFVCVLLCVCVCVPYRQGIADILSIHELHFDGDVAGRALPVGKVEALRIHVQDVPDEDRATTANKLYKS